MNQKFKRLFFRRRLNNFSNGNNSFWALCDYFRKSRDLVSPGNWNAHVLHFDASNPVSVIRKRVDELEQVVKAPCHDQQRRLRQISTALFCIVINCFLMGWVTKYPRNSKEGVTDEV
ncbi:MAG: hypothetical protein ACQ5SW_12355 [Sphaerochaetaceae bacterium]